MTRAWIWALGALLVATSWYPFVLDPPRRIANTALRLSDGSWKLDSNSLVISRIPAGLSESAQYRPFELRVEASTSLDGQSGPARLFSTGEHPWDPGLMIGIDHHEIVVRLPCGAPAPDAEAEWRLQFDSTRDIDLTLKVDNSLASHRVLYSVGTGRWEPLQNKCPRGASPTLPDVQRYLTLGNVASGHRPFVGQIRSLSLIGTAQTDDLLRTLRWEAPPNYWRWPERLYEPAPGLGSEALSFVWHFLSLAALAYLLATHATGRGLRGVAVIALALATTLVAGKLLIAGRHPSLLDFAVNVAGAMTGLYTHRFRASNRQ